MFFGLADVRLKNGGKEFVTNAQSRRELNPGVMGINDESLQRDGG